MPAEINFERYRVEQYLDELYTAAFLGADNEGRWEGLPPHLAVFPDVDTTIASVRALNWLTKDSVHIERPFGGALGADWRSATESEFERPLYKVRRSDLLGRICGAHLANGTSVSARSTEYEVFPGKLRFYSRDEVSGLPVVAYAIHGQDSYPLIAESIVLPLEPEHTVTTVHLSPEYFS